MHGMVRHADEIGLGEIVEFGGVEQVEEIGHKKFRLPQGKRRFSMAVKI
jgi:hypothetical protein